MQTKPKQIEVYITDDGKEFTDKEKAQMHEDMLKNTTFWIVAHGADTTEGRGYGKRTLLEVRHEGYATEALVMDYVYREYGRPITFVMGVSPMPAWHVRKLETAEEIHNATTNPGGIGDYKATVTKKVLVMTKTSQGYSYGLKEESQP